MAGCYSDEEKEAVMAALPGGMELLAARRDAAAAADADTAAVLRALYGGWWRDGERSAAAGEPVDGYTDADFPNEPCQTTARGGYVACEAYLTAAGVPWHASPADDPNTLRITMYGLNEAQRAYIAGRCQARVHPHAARDDRAAEQTVAGTLDDLTVALSTIDAADAESAAILRAALTTLAACTAAVAAMEPLARGALARTDGTPPVTER